VAAVLLGLVVLALPADVAYATGGAPRIGYRVVRVLPHSRDAFTEGLLWHEGRLYESTGLVGESSLREVDPATGRVLREQRVAPPIFAEGLALSGGRLYQLSWQQHVVTVWGLSCFCRLATHDLPGEGWGLTPDGTGRRLYLSDGSSRLRIIDPAGWRQVGSVDVHGPGGPVSSLNELEWTPDGLLANVWPSNVAVRIDPSTGRVTGKLDLSALGDAADRVDPDNVPNGIAYVPASGHVLVTGKRWAHMYELALT
jgi:glutaminyl-peptide cyclotransferase